MRQLNNYADTRLLNGCIYCGGDVETREHVPSKIFLDAPLPENLPVVGSCWQCNNGFSSDEEYLACLIEAVVSGSVISSHIRRLKVVEILKRSPNLRARLESAKYKKDERVYYSIEAARVRNILIKLAKGHAAYELSQIPTSEPTSMWWHPIGCMDDEKKEEFESDHFIYSFNEIGTRNMQRLILTDLIIKSEEGKMLSLPVLINPWIDVQEGRYRYLADDSSGSIIIKIVIGEYLACEVIWSAEEL